MKLKKLVLQTKNIDRLASFYSKILELNVAKYAGSIEIPMGQTIIVFEQTRKRTDPFYHFAINIPSNKIEEAKEWLSSKVELLFIEDYKSVIADFVNWNAKSVYFFDTGGNVVELIARFD